MQVCVPEEVGVSSAQLEVLARRMQQTVDEGVIGGCQVLLSRRDRVCHFSSHGWHDIAAGAPLRDDAVFRIYSMTKPIVSAAAMILFEEGRIRLQDPVRNYLPPIGDMRVYVDEDTTQEPQRPMLIRDLLTHTSGLTYGFFEEHPVDQIYKELGLPGTDRTDERFIEDLSQAPLAFHPGTAWQYSVSTDVLGLLVAEVSGMSLGEFLKRRIFEPLDMKDTGFVVPESERSRMPTCYTVAEDGALIPAQHLLPHRDPFIRETFESGGGGLAGTTADYLRFCRMLMHKGRLDGNRVLGRKTVEYMACNHLGEDLLPFRLGESNYAGYGFGLGFRVLMDPVPLMRLGGVGAFGWAGAADTYFWVDPGEELIGLYMGQHMPSGTHPGAHAFQTIAYAALID